MNLPSINQMKETHDNLNTAGFVQTPTPDICEHADLNQNTTEVYAVLCLLAWKKGSIPVTDGN